MFKLFEKPWFKWVVIGASSLIFISIFATFFIQAYLRRVELEQKKAEEIRIEQEYEEKFLNSMTRIYQNLKLEHYLAAYKNLEFLPEPKKNDPQRVDEYFEVLERIGNGLIQSQLLKESESVFLMLRNYSEQMNKANEALSRIESKHRIENANLFISQGEHLIGQKRYREAYNEFDKAQLELRSVEILRFDDVRAFWERLTPQLLESRYYTFISDAENFIQEAEKLIREKEFKKVDQTLTQASIKVGRAAYLRHDTPEVKKLQNKIIEIDAELGYLLPNEVPIWNRYSKESMGQEPHFFSLVGYELSSEINGKGELPLAFQFLMHAEDPYFVVRYRIFFYNNRDIFNGHFLMAEPGLNVDQIRSVIYLQEIPEALRKTAIKRIEVKVFDTNQNLVSRLSRAFRRPS